ncbi:MAG: hypothetical protein NUV57_05010, partial [archaeon]|nr:hypothetical protein [archaeon]
LKHMIAPDFFKSKFNQLLVVGLLLIGVIIFFAESNSPIAGNYPANAVHFFYSPTCPHCTAQKEFNPLLMEEYPDLNFFYHDISKSQEASFFMELSNKIGVEPKGKVPLTIAGEKYVLGFGTPETSGPMLRELLSAFQKNNGDVTVILEQKEPNENGFVLDLPFMGIIDVRNLSLPVLAIVLGLIDGFNPCAMWVLVYLISIVMALDDKKRLWLIVGSFVFASGVLYFLFMAAWLNAFLLIGYFRPLMLLVGLAALGGGLLSVKEYIETKGALECKIGEPQDKKKTMDRIKELVESPLTISTIIGIVVLAFVINSIEFACSSAIPAVFTQVLTLSNLPWWEHYGYILLYDVFFMLDDLIIFSLAAFAVSSEFGDKYAKYCKLFGGAILILLGLILVFAPNLLA